MNVFVQCICAACKGRFETNHFIEEINRIGTVSDDVEGNFVEMLYLGSPKCVRSIFANGLVNSAPVRMESVKGVVLSCVLFSIYKNRY